jgi:hypothetical protein
MRNAVSHGSRADYSNIFYRHNYLFQEGKCEENTFRLNKSIKNKIYSKQRNMEDS